MKRVFKVKPGIYDFLIELSKQAENAVNDMKRLESGVEISDAPGPERRELLKKRKKLGILLKKERITPMEYLDSCAETSDKTINIETR